MPILELDRRILLLMRTRGHSPALERIVAGYSRLAEHGGCWLALGTVGALSTHDPERRRRYRRGVGIVASSYLANQAVKFSVRRRRPELPGLPPLTSTASQRSFPSAHATTSFAAARAYAGLVPRSALYGAAIAFGLSRPYLGVHYPSDVVAGAALGRAIAIAGLARTSGAGGPA